ncbi:alpha/beta fold hydrolase [Archangium lansingense]|uniref:alpha/beta fold hydrolase n=1 Tax=Archangium lansingense TaxID=2995310 RepID=UPI003B800824
MKHLPKKREAVVDGQKLTYMLVGQGAPAIVLLNGAGGPLEGWYRLYPEIEKLGTVVAYDRPGVGGSPRPLEPQTGHTVVRTLWNLLRELGVKPPYVLVGHSFGGLHANLFARLYPNDVAGVVFLEAAAPDDIGMMKTHQSTAQRIVNGMLNLFSRPDPNDEVSNEQQTVTQLNAAAAFPNVPLCVISGGKTPPGWMSSPQALQLRAQHQDALARLSPRGHQIIASGSGHFPQMTEPGVVIQAIENVVKAARTESQSPSHQRTPASIG